MYTLASLGLRRSAAGFCMASVGLGALPRGRMYALASLVYALAPLWRGRRGTWCTAKGSDARPGVPWSPPLCRWLLRGRLGALQGVGCTPWRPLDSGGFWVAGAALGPLQGVGCTPWRPLVPLVALAWQVRHLVLCKGSDVRPGIPWSPPVVALPVAFAWQVRHPGPINTSRWLQSRQHPILTEVPQKFLKQCLFLWLPSIQSLPKRPVLTEVPSDLCDNNGPTLEPNKYKSTRTISSTSFRNLSKQCLSLWLPFYIPVFPKAS